MNRIFVYFALAGGIVLGWMFAWPKGMDEGVVTGAGSGYYIDEARKSDREAREARQKFEILQSEFLFRTNYLRELAEDDLKQWRARERDLTNRLVALKDVYVKLKSTTNDSTTNLIVLKNNVFTSSWSTAWPLTNK